MLQLSVVGYPFVNPGPVGGVGTFKNEQAGKSFIRAHERFEFQVEHSNKRQIFRLLIVLDY
jgi:hypothetical protein